MLIKNLMMIMMMIVSVQVPLYITVCYYITFGLPCPGAFIKQITLYLFVFPEEVGQFLNYNIYHCPFLVMSFSRT